MQSDPFGRAIRDHYRGERDAPLIQRDGAEALEHPIEQFYFEEFTPDAPAGKWLQSWVNGPLLDLGAGVGKHVLYFQDLFEAIGVEVSQHLVETMRERGVNDARQGDMFRLRDTFDPDRFSAIIALGTQLGLAKSMVGLRQFLGDLAFVTTLGGTAVLDCYDPECEATADLVGYRSDSTPGLAYRVMHFEYQGEVSETLLFQLFSPERVRKATIGTGWDVAEVQRGQGDNSPLYRIALTKN